MSASAARSEREISAASAAQFTLGDMTRLGRQRRQLQELRALCASGCVSRAVDLAFEHFTDFGRDEGVLALLGSAIEETATPAAVQTRFVELSAPPEFLAGA